jgi:DNA-directed RNA polymerase II subunit RPB1
LKKFLTEDVIRNVAGDTHALEQIEKEWELLTSDRQMLRSIFPSGNTKVD